jgi:hypothetical protein
MENCIYFLPRFFFLCLIFTLIEQISIIEKLKLYISGSSDLNLLRVDNDVDGNLTNRVT